MEMVEKQSHLILDIDVTIEHFSQDITYIIDSFKFNTLNLAFSHKQYYPSWLHLC